MIFLKSVCGYTRPCLVLAMLKFMLGALRWTDHGKLASDRRVQQVLRVPAWQEGQAATMRQPRLHNSANLAFAFTHLLRAFRPSFETPALVK